MKELYIPNLYLALMHYPVVNKNGEIIASAVTNLDLHDISRLSKTYGIRKFYVVTPLTDQGELVQRIVSHWINGTGSTYNPARREALELICIKQCLEDVVDHIYSSSGKSPKTVVTCARYDSGDLSFGKFRNMLESGNPYLLLFGTAWGFAENFITEADYRLDPIKGVADYNHLSVRSAASIILDRLIAKE